MTRAERDSLLRRMFDAAVAAADPMHVLPRFLPQRPAAGRVLVVGAGKASARMAQALEATWGRCDGVVCVPYGSMIPTQGVEVVEAAHPIPDAASAKAADRMLALAGELEEGDTLVALISGGGSALLAAPIEGLDLEDKRDICRALLTSGAPIDQMNIVRQQLSRIKGGGLAHAASPARVLTFIVSDVPGDDPALVASGPTMAPLGNRTEALAILERYKVVPSASVKAELMRDPEDRDILPPSTTQIIASSQGALEAAAAVAKSAGFTPIILGNAIEGEAAEMGRVLAGIALQVACFSQPAPPPVALICGGEATVTVRGSAGKGGRCTEFLLALAVALGERPAISALACDTDGRDGTETNAGAIWHGTDQFDSATARTLLAAHDAWTFFDKAKGLVETGPTYTNVNDLRVILIEAETTAAIASGL
ncbi:MAG: glycerate kinase [Alphaproteobacteria bacterium]|nr:glycerate kinase [Alphaproteobacteria bacterium]